MVVYCDILDFTKPTAQQDMVVYCDILDFTKPTAQQDMVVYCDISKLQIYQAVLRCSAMQRGRDVVNSNAFGNWLMS